MHKVPESQIIESTLEDLETCSSDSKVMNSSFISIPTVNDISRNKLTMLALQCKISSLNFISQLYQKNKWNTPSWASEPSETLHEILQWGKAASSDSPGSQSYKWFQNLLLEPVMNMLSHSFECGTFPLSLRKANISMVVFNKREMPWEVSLIVQSHCRIWILKSSLRRPSTSVVQKDQTGFIKAGHSYKSSRRLLNVIQLPEQ